MSKLRLAAIAAAAASVVAAATPSHALAQYESVTERVVTAQGPLGTGDGRPFVSVEAVMVDKTSGGLSAPTQTSASTACLTVDPPGTDQATQTYCGPAEIKISPTLRTATVSGVVHGISFVLEVVADSTPRVSAEPAGSTSSSVTVSRVGTATATMIGGAIGDAEAQGSSWYAEVREKAKTTATPQ